MIRSLRIERYRGFKRFEMGDLGRINLLVGRNNSGKTSVLEALHLLSSAGDPLSLWQHCGRRGERHPDPRDPRYVGDSEIDISHLFIGHELQVGADFTISAENQVPRRSISFTIAELSEKERHEAALDDDDEAIVAPRLALHVNTTPQTVPARSIPLSSRGGIGREAFDLPSRRISRRGRNDTVSTHYVSTESLTGDELVRIWDKIALTPQEDLVLSALRFLDPGIQRIATVGGPRYYNDRGGFIIKREDYTFPFPIGSLGDGTWRILAMAIVITQCRDGVLLIDEVDTGLHYTVMESMWRFIFEIARVFNVQVFATTHSYDCVQSLASICQTDVRANSQVTVQRIEMGRSRAIPFTESEIMIAAVRQIEIR